MDGNEVEISKAMPYDAKEMTLLHKKTWLDTYPNKLLGITKRDIENAFLNLPELIQKWEKVLSENENNKNILRLVAKINRKVVGICEIRNENGHAKLTRLYVDTKHQRKRIGEKLLKESINWAQGQDIYLWVADYTEEAITFYKKHGFIETGNKSPFRFSSEEITIPVIEMKRIYKKIS